MNLVDSSGWFEYFANGPNAKFFGPAIEELDELIVSSVNILEYLSAFSSNVEKQTR